MVQCRRASDKELIAIVERLAIVEEKIVSMGLGVQTALQAQERFTSAAFESSNIAINKAEIASDKRFDSVNEFREQLKDQAATLMPRSESEGKFIILTNMIHDLSSRIDKRDGADKGIGLVWFFVIGAIGMIGTLINIFWKH